jgi:hypothetical protein
MLGCRPVDRKKKKERKKKAKVVASEWTRDGSRIAEIAPRRYSFSSLAGHSNHT